VASAPAARVAATLARLLPGVSIGPPQRGSRFGAGARPKSVAFRADPKLENASSTRWPRAWASAMSRAPIAPVILR
jgi:hypothetical protein